MAERQPNSDRSTCVACDPPCSPGSLPADKEERLAALERLWAEVVKRGLVRVVPCGDDCEMDQFGVDHPDEYGCCEGHGWNWLWSSPASDEERQGA